MKDNTITIKRAGSQYPESYYVLVMQNNAAGREWKLQVRKTPSCEITFTGVEPTLEEVFQAAMSIPMMQIWSIEIIQVIIGVEVQKRQARQAVDNT